MPYVLLITFLIMVGTALPRPEGRTPDKPFVYRGFYRHDKRVIFAYRIGDEDYLDAPWVEDGTFTRISEKILFPDRSVPSAGLSSMRPPETATILLQDSEATPRIRATAGQGKRLRGLVHAPFEKGFAERIATDTLNARIREIDEAIPLTESMITEARNVGADVSEADRWLEKSKVAASGREYVLAGELVKRAERAAMQSQHHQIEKAMELRRRQVEKAQALIEAVEPLVEEAEEFDIDVMEAQTLLRQAQDVLAKGDYVNGTVYARNAAEVARRLEPKLVEERGKRGILKPEKGVCGNCGSTRLTFADDGAGKCIDCGRAFRWRVPSTRWERFVAALRD